MQAIFRNMRRSLEAHPLQWAGQAFYFFFLWGLFVSQLSSHEFLVGAGAVLLTILGVAAAMTQAHPRFNPKGSWAVEARRLPGSILLDCGILARWLWHRRFETPHSQGQFLTVPFEFGGDDARSATRRALMIFYSSVSPNFIAIELDREKQILLYHQNVRTSVPRIVTDLSSP